MVQSLVMVPILAIGDFEGRNTWEAFAETEERRWYWCIG